MQDIEFTIENGKLYLLQTRNGKRTARAAIEIAVDMVNEGLITRKETVANVDVKSIDQLLHPNFKEEALEQATVISKLGYLQVQVQQQAKSSSQLKMRKNKLKRSS